MSAAVKAYREDGILWTDFKSRRANRENCRAAFEISRYFQDNLKTAGYSHFPADSVSKIDSRLHTFSPPVILYNITFVQGGTAVAALLSVHDLCYTYHTPKADTLALQNISFSVEQGEFVSIVGPSGCGKSTLLSIIAGLNHPDSGTITLHTDAVHPVGYMFQHDHLLEWRTILSNACLGLEIRGALTPENKEYVRQMLHQYGLGDFTGHRPSQLSGGMRQRAALVRTLALKPELLLLDEPFSALDYQTRLSVADEIWRILRRTGKTAVLVTHDISEAISLGDRVIVLSSRPGEVLYDMTTDFGPDRSPLSVRSLPLFQTYFQKIWKAMTQPEGDVSHAPQP